MFEEGPGLAEGDGSDLEELKDYVMAELLWDPSLDPDQVILKCCSVFRLLESPSVRLSSRVQSPRNPEKKIGEQVIAEFLLLYYGPLGSPFVKEYMDTMWAATRDVPLSVLISPPPAGTFGCYPQVPNNRPANGCHPSYLTPMALVSAITTVLCGGSGKLCFSFAVCNSSHLNSSVCFSFAVC